MVIEAGCGGLAPVGFLSPPGQRNQQHVGAIRLLAQRARCGMAVELRQADIQYRDIGALEQDIQSQGQGAAVPAELAQRMENLLGRLKLVNEALTEPGGSAAT
jgi:hypothetical protein